MFTALNVAGLSPSLHAPRVKFVPSPVSQGEHWLLTPYGWMEGNQKCCMFMILTVDEAVFSQCGRVKAQLPYLKIDKLW